MMLLAVMAFIANAQTKKYLGGDASLLPSYQEKGTVYKDFDGHKVKFLPFVKQQGWNMIRVRLFVDPQNAPEGHFLPFVKQQGWNMIRVRLFVDPQNAPEGHKGEGVCQDLNYVIGLCQQIKKTGMQVMLDFHYSDTWADPGKQFTPKRWEGCNKQQLADSVYAYTRASLAKTLGRLQQTAACRQCLCLHSCFATSDETGWRRARDDTGWQ